MKKDVYKSREITNIFLKECFKYLQQIITSIIKSNYLVLSKKVSRLLNLKMNKEKLVIFKQSLKIFKIKNITQIIQHLYKVNQNLNKIKFNILLKIMNSIISTQICNKAKKNYFIIKMNETKLS